MKIRSVEEATCGTMLDGRTLEAVVICYFKIGCMSSSMNIRDWLRFPPALVVLVAATTAVLDITCEESVGSKESSRF